MPPSDDDGSRKGDNKHDDNIAEFPFHCPTRITWLFTLNMLRNAGFGRKLIELVSAFTYLKVGHNYIVTVVDVAERSTYHFYKRLGFVLCKNWNLLPFNDPKFIQHESHIHLKSILKSLRSDPKITPK